MTLILGPYICDGVINCGHLQERARNDARAAMAGSRAEALRWLAHMKQAHADWYKDSRPSKRELQKLNTPFLAAIRELEDWLRETQPPPPAKRPRPKSGFVYIIGLEGDNSAVKIGFASKLEDRVSMLQTSSHHALKILSAIKGTAKVEKELHRKFAADHIRGEWFRRTEAIEAFIATRHSGT
jgi:hypothetical protein